MIAMMKITAFPIMRGILGQHWLIRPTHASPPPTIHSIHSIFKRFLLIFSAHQQRLLKHHYNITNATQRTKSVIEFRENKTKLDFKLKAFMLQLEVYGPYGPDF